MVTERTNFDSSNYTHVYADISWQEWSMTFVFYTFFTLQASRTRNTRTIRRPLHAQFLLHTTLLSLFTNHVIFKSHIYTLHINHLGKIMNWLCFYFNILSNPVQLCNILPLSLQQITSIWYFPMWIKYMSSWNDPLYEVNLFFFLKNLILIYCYGIIGHHSTTLPLEPLSVLNFVEFSCTKETILTIQNFEY